MKNVRCVLSSIGIGHREPEGQPSRERRGVPKVSVLSAFLRFHSFAA